MAKTPDRSLDPETAKTPQAIFNDSFDPQFGVLVAEQLGYDGKNMVRQRADAAAVRYDTAGYVGYAAAGAAETDPVWQITKLDTSSGVAITFADGDSNYDNIWANRASLAYL